MNAVGAYAKVHARVRAMYADLIDTAAWERFNECPDIQSLINALKDSIYGPYLSDLEEKQLNSRRVAYEIRKRLTSDFYSILGGAPKYTVPLLEQIFRLYEVDNLKGVLRGIEIGEDWDRIRFMLFPMENFSTVPYQAMVEIESVSGAVDVLRGFQYHSTLSHALDRYTTEKSLFPLEVALDLDYWREIWRDLNELPPDERIKAKSIIGMVVDHNNLMWAARYRYYHHLSEEEIINYTLPFGYRVTDSIIRSIAAGEEVIDRVVDIYPVLEKFLTTMRDPVKDLPELEIRLQRLLAAQCHQAFVGYPFHVGILIAYLFLVEFEIQDLTVLLEAKSLGISRMNYQPFLIMNEQPVEADMQAKW